MLKKLQIKNNSKIKQHSGFTLVEMLVYLFIMTLVSIALIQSLVIVFKSNRASFADSNIRNSGYSAMEAMVREIKASQSVDVINSILYPSKVGVLQLNQLDASGNPYIVKFATSSSQTLNLSQGSTTPVLVGPITLGGTKVLNLTFHSIDTSNSKAVRIQLNIGATANGVSKSEWFYSTVILRGSY